jgi:hypothetical protein
VSYDDHCQPDDLTKNGDDENVRYPLAYGDLPHAYQDEHDIDQ